MTTRFEGRSVIVTGGAWGMGESHVRGFAAEGANVVIADVLDDEGSALADELGSVAVYLHLDVSDEGQWRSTVQRAESAFGPVNVLVNDAGISGVPATLVDTDLDVWRRVLAVNLDGTFLGTRPPCVDAPRRGHPRTAGIERVATPADVTPVVFFVASPEAG